jgi:hypothetical protein
MGNMRNTYKYFVGKTERKRVLGRNRRRREDNIKMDLIYIGRNGCELTSSGSEYEPVVGSCEHGNETVFDKGLGIS